MVNRRRTAWLGFSLFAGALLLAGRSEPVRGQWPGSVPGAQFELADAVEIDQVDNAVRLQLERVKALLADRQWDEAVEILRRLAEAPEGKLVGVTAQRYVGLRDWCQWQLAALPPEALQLYRARVDPVAQEWYERGIAGRDRTLLENVVDRAFASSYGDRALMALGEIALESGDYAAARSYWERIVPAAEGSGFRGQGSDPANQQSEIRNQKSPATLSPWPSYPDTRLDLAAVRRGWCWCRFWKGKLAGRGPNWRRWPGCTPTPKAGWAAARETTSNCSSRCWPKAHPGPPPRPIPTGSPSPAIRNATRSPRRWWTSARWRGESHFRLPLASGAAGRLVRGRGAGGEGFAADNRAFHPCWSAICCWSTMPQQILAVRPQRASRRGASPPQSISPSWPARRALPCFSADTLGTPQYTMTVCHNRLYARMGPALTGQPQGMTLERRARLSGLPGPGGGGTAALENRAGRGLGAGRLAAGRPAGRLRGDAPPRRPPAGRRGLFRRGHGPAPLAAVRLRRGDPRPRPAARVYPQSAHAGRRDALLQHESRARWLRCGPRTAGFSG